MDDARHAFERLEVNEVVARIPGKLDKAGRGLSQ
jgi:hypothetical protein